MEPFTTEFTPSPPRHESMMFQGDAFEDEVKKIERSPTWEALQNFVAGVIINEISHRGCVVLDLDAQGGRDVGKFQRAGGMNVTHIQREKIVVDEARKRWNQKQRPYQGQFIVGDPCERGFEVLLPRGMMYDVILNWEPLARPFQTEAGARLFFGQLLKAKLRSGGFFATIVPDTSALWYRCQKQVAPGPVCIRTESFMCRVETADFSTFGTPCVLEVDKRGPLRIGLTHFPTIIRLASQLADLELIGIFNMAVGGSFSIFKGSGGELEQEFFSEHRQHYPLLASTVFKPPGTNMSGPIPQSVQELLGLHAIVLMKRR